MSRDAVRHWDNMRHHMERRKGERLDRKDGTGRWHELEKKHGAGKANWGPLTDILEAMDDEEQHAGAPAVSPHDFVDDKQVLTLDEYEKKLKEGRS